MKNRKKSLKRIMFLLICAGVIFTAFALLLFLSKGSFIRFPRTDIAPVGFAVVGVLYFIGAIGIYLVTHDKKAWIEDNDERSKIIEASSGFIAFGVQTVLLFTVIFLMIFTGYLNLITAFCFITVLTVSIIVFAAAQIYYSKKI